MIEDPLDLDADALNLFEPPSIVFILSSHIARYSFNIRRHLLCRAYRSCRVFTALGESLHVAELDLEPDLLSAFDAYLGFGEGYFSLAETKIRAWVIESGRKHEVDPDEDEDIEVAVEYVPLSFAMITSEFFTVPLVETLFPNFNVAVAPIAKSLDAPSSFDVKIFYFSFVSFNLISELLQKQTRQLAFSLYSLLESLKLKEEIFTLDLTTPMSHSDNLLDLTFRTLSPYLSDSSDRKISTSPLLKNSKIFQFSLSHGADAETVDFFRALTMLSQKDALVATRKRLVDLIAKVQPEKRPRVLGRLTIDQMDSLISVFKGNEAVFVSHGAMLSAVVGVIESVKSSKYKNDASLASIENLICQSLFESQNDPACAILPIIDILKKVSLSLAQEISLLRKSSSPSSSQLSLSPLSSTLRSDDNNSLPLTLQDALTIAVFSFSLLGPPESAVAVRLRNELNEKLKISLIDCVQAIKGKGSREIDEMWANEVLERLDLVSRARSSLIQKR
ncbi:Sec1 domain-containing protein 2, partial [Physocladia obscura]